MTENKIKDIIRRVVENRFLTKSEIEYVSQAIEEIQQYRAIGTMEGYKRALEISKENFRVGMEYKAKVKDYQSIGTIEECRTAVERMKPKRPNDIVMAKDRKICVGRVGKCPCCGNIVAEDNFTCEDCFQVLDWSE